MSDVEFGLGIVIWLFICCLSGSVLIFLIFDWGRVFYERKRLKGMETSCASDDGVQFISCLNDDYYEAQRLEFLNKFRRKREAIKWFREEL